MVLRRFLPVLVVALLGGALLLGGPILGPRACRADEAAEPVPVDVAMQALKRLEKALKSRRSVNDDLNSFLEEVAEAYKNLAPPPEPEFDKIPDGASEDQIKAINRGNEKKKQAQKAALARFETDKKKFRKGAIKAFIKAFKLQKINERNESNQRDDVNTKAVEILGGLDGDEKTRAKISAQIILALDRTIFKAKGYQVPTLLLDTAFASLGKLANIGNLEWMREKFIHTRNSPDQVDRLNSAHKAMLLFHDVEGKIRYSIVEAMVTTYSGPESQAEHGNPTDKKVQTAKAFWDKVKNDVIKVIQYYAGQPADENGELLASVEDFQKWWRKHKNPKRAPWRDEAPAKRGK